MLGVLRLYRELLGRKVYLLFFLMPFSTLSESLGIALLLPLLAALDSGEGLGGQDGGVVGNVLAWLPLPESPLALLALIAVAFVFKAALRFATDSVTGIFQSQLMFRLRVNFVDAYTNLSYRAFSKRNTGHYVNIVTGQATRFARAFQAISNLMMGVAAAVVYLGVAAMVNWQFALIAVFAGAAFMLTMKVLNEYVRNLSRQTAAEQSNLNKQLVQVLHALKYLMATVRSEGLARRIHTSCHKLFGFQVRTNVAQAFSRSVREPLSIILVLGLIAVQLYFFEQRLAVIFVALLLLHRATQALFGIQGSWQQAMELVGSAEMVQDELQWVKRHREQRGSKQLADFQQVVKFQDVSFAYDPADGEVLHAVDISIPRNQTIALVGHSGAGKSTFADLLSLLLRPMNGRILIDGHDASDIDPRTWRRQLGYVCQETVVFDETIAANICLSETAYTEDEDCRERVHKAARQAFASEFIETLPNGYETIVGDRGVRLSGGQRQRLFIARELYKQPKLLILDEATSALDGASERAIQESIEALHGHVTVVVIAHRLATIKNADYIYVLDRGNVIEHGPYEQLHANTDSSFRRMVELQKL